MSEEGRTACYECANHAFTGQNAVLPDVWYNLVCKALPRPPVFDPLTGRDVMPIPAYAYCRDVNDGQCRYFVQASPEERLLLEV